MQNDKRRLTVDLTQRSCRALTEITELTQDNMAASINKAVQLYAYLRAIQENGGALYVRKVEGEAIECIRLM